MPPVFAACAPPASFQGISETDLGGLQGWSQAEQDSSQQRNQKGEAEKPPVEANRIEPRNRGRHDSNQEAERQRCQCESQSATQQPQYQAFQIVTPADMRR